MEGTASECFIIGLHKKKAAEMFSASEGWIRIMKIYPNIIVETVFYFLFKVN